MARCGSRRSRAPVSRRRVAHGAQGIYYFVYALKGAWSSVGSDETDLALPKGGGFLLRLAK